MRALKRSLIEDAGDLDLPAPLEVVVREISDLLSIFESTCSRSSKDVFPFYLKHVELYHQLSKMLPVVRSRLESVKTLDAYARVDLQFLIDVLEGLELLTHEVVANPALSRDVDELERIFDAFQEVRLILGQEDKSGKEIQEDVEEFLASLESEDSMGEIYEIMKKRFERYEEELYVAYDNKFVPRTNNDLEAFNNCLKRPIRKGQGRKKSWFYVEHQGVPATFYHNLLCAPHVVGGAEISWDSDQTPLERIGVLEKVSVTEIMNLIKREVLCKRLVQNDELYTVHRWTRRIFKRGLGPCLASLDSKWSDLMEELIPEKKLNKGGQTSPS